MTTPLASLSIALYRTLLETPDSQGYNEGMALSKSKIRRYASLFGIDAEEAEAILASQLGLCAICFCEEIEAANASFHLDHNKKTGALREFLCGNCNTGIGMFHEDPERLRSAIRYLKRHNPQLD